MAWLTEKRRREADLANAETASSPTNHSMDYQPKEDAELSNAHWDRKKARLDYERALFRFEVKKQKYLPVNELTITFGQLLVGFRTALNMLPGNAARWVVGLRDFHQVKDKLQSEVDAILRALHRCDYLREEPLKAIAQSVPTSCNRLARKGANSFIGMLEADFESNAALFGGPRRHCIKITFRKSV